MPVSVHDEDTDYDASQSRGLKIVDQFRHAVRVVHSPTYVRFTEQFRIHRSRKPCHCQLVPSFSYILAPRPSLSFADVLTYWQVALLDALKHSKSINDRDMLVRFYSPASSFPRLTGYAARPHSSNMPSSSCLASPTVHSLNYSRMRSSNYASHLTISTQYPLLISRILLNSLLRPSPPPRHVHGRVPISQCRRLWKQCLHTRHGQGWYAVQPQRPGNPRARPVGASRSRCRFPSTPQKRQGVYREILGGVSLELHIHQFEPHPGGLSSLMFSFATLVIHRYAYILFFPLGLMFPG